MLSIYTLFTFRRQWEINDVEMRTFVEPLVIILKKVPLDANV